VDNSLFLVRSGDWVLAPNFLLPLPVSTLRGPLSETLLFVFRSVDRKELWQTYTSWKCVMNFGSNIVLRGRTGAGLRQVLDDHRPRAPIINASNSNGDSSHGNTQKQPSGQGKTTEVELRIPEIQMINKFYGLIPKKFLFSERVQPSHRRHKR